MTRFRLELMGGWARKDRSIQYISSTEIKNKTRTKVRSPTEAGHGRHQVALSVVLLLKFHAVLRTFLRASIVDPLHNTSRRTMMNKVKLLSAAAILVTALSAPAFAQGKGGEGGGGAA